MIVIFFMFRSFNLLGVVIQTFSFFLPNYSFQLLASVCELFLQMLFTVITSKSWFSQNLYVCGSLFEWLLDCLIFFFFFVFPKKTTSISYKMLHMRLIYTNPQRNTIGPPYVDAHQLNKGGGQPLLDEGQSLSFNSIRVALEAIILAFQSGYNFTISLALTLLATRFGWRRLVCTVVSIESKELLD